MATADLNQYYGTGRRKCSVARVYLRPGNGNIEINKQCIDEYFGREVLKTICLQPLKLTGTEGSSTSKVNVREAACLDRQVPFATASLEHFLEYDQDLRTPLKRAGVLDPGS